MKICFKCNDTKPLDDFYKHSGTSDGRFGKCKECTKSDVRANRLKNVERYRAFDVDRYQDPRRKAAVDMRSAAHIKSHPVATKARYGVSNAVRDGRLTKAPCEVCGEKKVHAHHDDYAKPLKVRWLCVPHHSEWHKKNGAGLNYG